MLIRLRVVINLQYLQKSNHHVIHLKLMLHINYSMLSHSVVSDSATPLTASCQAPLCSTTSWIVCSNSCPLSRWCHPTISSSVAPFSPCPQSFPALGSFLMSQLFTSGGQSIGASVFSISPSNEYSGLISFRIDWFDLLAVQGNLKSLLQHHSSKASCIYLLICPHQVLAAAYKILYLQHANC